MYTKVRLASSKNLYKFWGTEWKSFIHFNYFINTNIRKLLLS